MDYLINRRLADYRHGTGVQLKLFADHAGGEPLHICWDDARPVKETYEPTYNLNTSLLRVWPFRRGKGLVARLEDKVGLIWHEQTRITKRIKKLAGAGKLRAYVIIASEAEAQIARWVLEALEAEYVVKVVDYLHMGDTELTDYPNLFAVLKGAKRAFALTPTIQQALANISQLDDIAILADGRKPSQQLAKASFQDGSTLEIVMVGSVAYTRGLQELEKLCNGLERVGIKYTLNYIGSLEMRKLLGTRLPINYQGVLSDTKRDELLSSMHLAYLPGPDGNPAEDYLARFSFPSRLHDYFWHGLPVVGPLFRDSATTQMLTSLAGKGVWFSQDAKELVSVVKNLVQEPAKWESASEIIYQFAQQNFSIERCTNTILEAFNS